MALSEYFGTLIAISAVVAFASLLAHDGQGARAAAPCLGIILLFVAATPVIGAVGNIADGTYSDLFGDLDALPEEGEGDYYEAVADAFALGVERMVESEFSLRDSDVTVAVKGFVLTEMRAQSVCVVLSGAAVTADARAIKSRVKEAGLGECEVKFEFK